MSAVRFGVIGGAAIARRSILPAIRATPGAVLEVLASRSEERRRELGGLFGVRTVGEYEAVLADPRVDAVYIALPSALHETWTLRALDAGKHVYCEKPAVLDAAGAERVTGLARARRLVFLEGFMHLFHPQHQAVRALLADGAIGTPLHVDGWFGFPPLGPSNIRYRADLGGGIVNDAAGYPIHAARLLFGAEPLGMSGTLFRVSQHDVEVRAALALEFPGGRTASAVVGIGLGYRNAYSVWGSEGQLLLERAFSCPPDHAPTIALRGRDGRESVHRLEPADHFRHAVGAFVEAVRGERPFDAFLPDFLALAGILDTVRRTARVTTVP